MKKFLYFGACLMIGACVYGFVDYKNTSHEKEFINMYEKETPAPVVKNEQSTTDLKNNPVADKKIAINTTDVTKEKVASTEKNQKFSRSKKLDFRDFSRAPLKKTEKIENVEVIDSGSHQ